MAYANPIIARINHSKLGIIKRNLSNIEWVISGDYGYDCIKDYSRNVEFRLYDSGKLLFLSGYNSNYGAWGDYTEMVEIKDIEKLIKMPNWYSRLRSAKKSTFSPTIVMF